MWPKVRYSTSILGSWNCNWSLEGTGVFQWRFGRIPLWLVLAFSCPLVPTGPQKQAGNIWKHMETWDFGIPNNGSLPMSVSMFESWYVSTNRAGSIITTEPYSPSLGLIGFHKRNHPLYVARIPVNDCVFFDPEVHLRFDHSIEHATGWNILEDLDPCPDTSQRNLHVSQWWILVGCWHHHPSVGRYPNHDIIQICW